MAEEFTTMGIVFMGLAWILVISLTVFSVWRVLGKNKLADKSD
ncbi:MAG: hypothetical protein RO257_00680 [Candidatus Kapabacteria bacterium]|nr:hypothetical protein [Candidatus Kapabacteria bacterium]